MSSLAGKVAVVTGASKGIGAAIAQALCAAGAPVVVNSAFSRGSANRVLSEITATGGNVIAVQANASFWVTGETILGSGGAR